MSTINDVTVPDKSNIQGMILRGFTHPYSCHMVFKFKDQPGAKSFIKAIFPYVQSAESWGDEKPDLMLNIGLTCSGIATVSNLNATDMKYFPWTFQKGPASGGSQQSLNDCGPSDPSNWAFGNTTQQVDCVVHTYAMSPQTLKQLVSIVSNAATAGGLTEYLPLDEGTKRLEEYALIPRNSIHFGYLDGIDQPKLGWTNPMDPSDLRNFLIGYPPSAFSPGPTLGDAGTFAKDGCYNAFRILLQDVELFDNFLSTNAENIAKTIGQTPKYAKEWLAAKLNGRWINGSPLELSPDEPDPKTSHSTKFGYAGDTSGIKCPFAAHSRVANPRDEKLSEQGPVPRLIRRGMAYGAPPLINSYKGERGLIGLFLCGSLPTQFELLYSWINTTNFSPVFPSQNGQDALIANRSMETADTSFTIPTDKGPVVIKDMPQFVVTRGTAYCLLPSLSTLKSLAE
ncbi:MAG: peroxidase [Mucilaginibacter sp.]|nr:peroxidase [Mucilaginibacter sp.]